MDTVVGFSGEDTGFFFRFTREGFGIFRCAENVECEVESVEDALLAAKTGADIVMFDNMTPELNVDVISMGALTHSVRCADVSLEVDI